MGTYSLNFILLQLSAEGIFYFVTKPLNMGLYKNEGDAALTLAEECAEVIQVITKKYRFGGDWNEIPPGKSQTRLEELKAEMADVIFAYEKFINQNSKT